MSSSFEVRNLFLIPNFPKAVRLTEVFVPRGASVVINRDPTPGHVIIKSVGNEDNDIKVDTNDIVVLRHEKRFFPVQIITGR